MIVAFAFIALGYPILYWGANQLKHWDRSIQQTDAAPLSLLFGVATPQSLKAADKLPSHPVPFPYTPPKKATGDAQPSSNGSSSGTPGGAQLSPNFPGGSGSTIPTPPVPGGGLSA